MAYDRTNFLFDHGTSIIIDANMEFHYQMAIDNFANHNAKLYFVKLECSEETIIKRILKRKEHFLTNPDNYSRADLEDYYTYLENKKIKPKFPEEAIFYTINTDTTLEEIEKQVDELAEKIKQDK